MQVNQTKASKNSFNKPTQEHGKYWRGCRRRRFDGNPESFSVAPDTTITFISGSSKTLNQTSHKTKLDRRQLVYSTNQFSPQYETLKDWASSIHRASLGKPKHGKSKTRKSKYLLMWTLAVCLLHIRYVRGWRHTYHSHDQNVSWCINNVSMHFNKEKKYAGSICTLWMLACESVPSLWKWPYNMNSSKA